MEGRLGERYFKIVEKKGCPVYTISYHNSAGGLTLIKSETLEAAEDIMKELRAKGIQFGCSINLTNCIPLHLKIGKKLHPSSSKDEMPEGRGV